MTSLHNQCEDVDGVREDVGEDDVDVDARGKDVVAMVTQLQH